jgi:hypothetical protein
MRLPAADITDVNLCTERTDAAEGAKRVTVIHTRDRMPDAVRCAIDQDCNFVLNAPGFCSIDFVRRD